MARAQVSGLNPRGALAVAVTIFLFTWTLTTHGKYSVSGDEPHYLIIAESLRTDGDLDLANNYRQNDGRLFGHDQLTIGLHALPSRLGDVRSIHGIGVPVTILPVYVVAQRIGSVTSEDLLRRFRMDRGLFVYSIVSLFLIALTSCGLALLAVGLSAIVAPRWAAGIAIALGISPPIVSHAFLIFPEVLALFVSCCTVWFITKHPAARDRRTLLVLALAMGLLPWCHQKYLVYSPALLLITAWVRRDVILGLTRTEIASIAAVFAGPQLALMLWLRHEWGTPGGALTTGILTSAAIPLSLDTFRAGALGLWFDRYSGLLAYAPLFWMLPACWALTWRRSLIYVLPLLALYIPAAAFVIGWWAGFSPAARYLVPAVPLMAIPVALACSHVIVRRMAVLLLALQLPINLVIWQHPRWMWPHADGNRALQALGAAGRGYEALLPPVQVEGVTQGITVPLLAMTVLTLMVIGVVRTRKTVYGLNDS